jgi:hypothetical protein
VCAIELTCHRQQRIADEGGLILSDTGQQEHPFQNSIRQCNAVSSRDARPSATFMTAHGRDSFLPVAGLPNPLPAGHPLLLGSPSNRRYGVSGMCSMAQ